MSCYKSASEDVVLPAKIQHGVNSGDHQSIRGIPTAKVLEVEKLIDDMITQNLIELSISLRFPLVVLVTDVDIE